MKFIDLFIATITYQERPEKLEVRRQPFFSTQRGVKSYRLSPVHIWILFENDFIEDWLSPEHLGDTKSIKGFFLTWMSKLPWLLVTKLKMIRFWAPFAWPFLSNQYHFSAFEIKLIEYLFTHAECCLTFTSFLVNRPRVLCPESKMILHKVNR